MEEKHEWSVTPNNSNPESLTHIHTRERKKITHESQEPNAKTQM